jgi:hypothetical protein
VANRSEEKGINRSPEDYERLRNFPAAAAPFAVAGLEFSRALLLLSWNYLAISV